VRRRLHHVAVLGVVALLLGVRPAPAQDGLTIWSEFVRLVRTDGLTLDRIRPVAPMTAESQLALLKDFAKGTDWREWEATPEVVRHGNLLTFVATLGRSRNSPWAYTFNFEIDNGRWYYRFLEGIVIRLDKLPSLPVDASGLADLPEDRKAWMREETYWSEQVRLFNFLTREKGKDLAFRWVGEGIGNGAGYVLAASVWIPFYPPRQAFILFLCWEQAKLHGNNVTLEKLDDDQAVVRLEDLQYFALYQRASHLKQQISFEDYIRIFETIWQERARAAGWKLMVDGQGRRIFLRFSK